MEWLKSLCLLLVLSVGFVRSSEGGHVFIVGGTDGWTLHPAENYNRWAERMRFTVNDVIEFRFKAGSDSVLEVDEEDYRKCNLQNPKDKLEGDISDYCISESGSLFFISGHPGNCNQGQKLHIVVLAVRPPPLTPSSISTIPSPAVTHSESRLSSIPTSMLSANYTPPPAKSQVPTAAGKHGPPARKLVAT